MQKKIKNHYSNLATSIKSSGRLIKEPSNDLRSEYQRDRDRVIHCTAFRRLKHKTQVFVNTVDDHYRTRITHSLEVSQIARTLAKHFNLNEDLCETLSLAHDLGHTPFGHAGEESLNKCMIDHGGFDHNLQTIRVVTLLENKYLRFKGLNLTIETLDGLLKHNGPLRDTKKLENMIGLKYFKKKIIFKNRPSFEAQIAAISDDIAYNSHDLEDGLKAGLFKVKDLQEIDIIKLFIKKYKSKMITDEMITKILSRELINYLVIDVIQNTKKNIKMNNIKSLNSLYHSNINVVNFSSKVKELDTQIKDFLKRKMYYSPEVLKRTNNGKKVIALLFKKIIRSPSKINEIKINKKQNIYRQVSDFIAGMTDRYALRLYKKLT
tara:strand:- start:557 stop:1690 length:1134 start_codon:yes stop_codon:yes gene_type:complete